MESLKKYKIELRAVMPVRIDVEVMAASEGEAESRAIDNAYNDNYHDIMVTKMMREGGDFDQFEVTEIKVAGE